MILFSEVVWDCRGGVCLRKCIGTLCTWSRELVWGQRSLEWFCAVKGVLGRCVIAWVAAISLKA